MTWKSIHTVVVPIGPRVCIFPKGTAVSRQRDPFNNGPAGIFSVPHCSEAPPEGIGHNDLPQHKRRHVVVCPLLQDFVQGGIIHRHPGISILPVQAEGDQAERVGQDPVSRRNGRELFCIGPAGLDDLFTRKHPLKQLAHLFPRQGRFFHRSPGNHRPVQNHRLPPPLDLAITTA